MKISELIERLQAIAQQHGDIEVLRHAWNDPKTPDHIVRVSVIAVRNRAPQFPNIYVRDDAIETGGFAGRPAFTEPHLSEVRANPVFNVAFIA